MKGSSWAGNPARRCRLSFSFEIDQKFSKIYYGVNKAVKLTFYESKFKISVLTSIKDVEKGQLRQ